MTKHGILTEEEFKTYKPPARAVACLNEFMTAKGCHESEIKVLDWGCGRGRFVLWLREKGFNAFGVDIDAEPVENGLTLFKAKGYKDTPLTLIPTSGRTVYADEFFDFLMSDNVLEHVSNIQVAMDEIGRVTAANGSGYHIFPAQWQIIEGHLFMPFVHWIPQGLFRKAVISLFVKLGIEPKWKELEGRSNNEKVDTYYKYSKDNIFYRRFSFVQQQFEKQGFKVTFQTINNPAVSRNRLLGPFARNRITKPIFNWMLLTFKQVEMVIKKGS
ncbi:MAG: Ubiquinone/menaquinone biosynthesis methylase-like protein [Chloroflexi bacterium]|nr:MAG: Ubiquinone/menaquinone biosynthesis methylase-like protein [Chloroflexota bacterium]